ncbi:HTH_48 domain-containing protein [Trichonephila clavipes]|nr:HTH_48 domain-containing protein [Trichonephila clavipes]
MEALPFFHFPATCDFQSVIKYLNAQSIAPIETHRKLCEVYGTNIMNKQMLHRWCRQFSEGCQSVHDEERSRRLMIMLLSLCDSAQWRTVSSRLRCGMLTACVLLLHDSACPHTARKTAAVLTESGWELFDQPPYNPL